MDPSALDILTEIETTISRAGFNCTCAYGPDNVTVDKDWLDNRLERLRRILLLEIQPTT